MKARELRIGNWLKWIGKEIQVKGLHDESVFTSDSHEVEQGSVYLEPISLDESWLEKFGFEKDILESGVVKHTKYFKGRTQWEGGLKLHDHGTDSWFPSIVEGHSHYCALGHLVKHVHQLQNLYFVLSGEELKLKEKI